MDWASSQWKQELPPLAIQNINALEEKIERLQKEKQQKQLQCECLELALEKEKRKVENEKQQITSSQRELQSLADVCKDFENKQQRLQNEIQNRDNRIANLEGLLSQAKKENCRLQQSENDLKELRSVREASLLEREQKNESFSSVQNGNLQGKKINLLSDSLAENSEMSVVTEKENNCSLNENDLLSSLRKKISDQEKIIQELNLKLVSIADKESTKEPHHAYSKTPGRPQMESVEASPALRIKSVWDSFTTTPAKENKESVLRHHSDSSATGSSDEKLVALQTRLKQLCQELDCQRHNFEASKVSMEQKFKEKENALKAELKYQAQATADLDKELKDIRNKYQQEINQSTKKLDILTAQLKKTEETKAILEKEVKNMESKISTCTLSLKTKEEEVQDLQKLKNMADATIQSLQVQVRDLERKCKNVQEENSTLSETVNAVKLQLDGSCNLAQEREADLTKVKKELENLSASQKNLLNENQELQNRIVVAQSKTEELLRSEAVLKEQVERTEKERLQLTGQLNLETKKSQDLALVVEEQKSQVSSQREELSRMELELTEFNREFADKKLEFEEKICDLDNKLNHTEKDNAELVEKLRECSSRENLLMEKLDKTENEKKELLDKLGNEIKKLQELEINMADYKQVISHLKEELSNESAKYNQLNIQLSTSKEEYEAKIQELETYLSTTKRECAALENKVKDLSLNELSLKEKLELIEKEKEEATSLVKTEKNLRQCLESSISDLNDQIKSLNEELAGKSVENTELKSTCESLATDFKAKTENLEEKLALSLSEVSTLSNQLQSVFSNETILKDQLQMLEKDNEEFSKRLATEIKNVENLLAKEEELKTKISSLERELSSNSTELEKANQLKEASTEDFKGKIQQLEINLNTSRKECADLENKLQEYCITESALKEKLEQISNEKQEAVAQLTAEKSLRLNLESSILELNNQIKLLEEERTCKSLELNELKKRIENSKNEHEEQLSMMSKKEKLLLEEMNLLKKEKDSLSEELESAKNEVQKHQATSAELELNVQVLNNELTQKTSEFDKIQNQVPLLEKEYEAKIQDLNTKLSSIEAECSVSQNELKNFLLEHAYAEEKLKLVEENNNKLNEDLSSEISKSEQLQCSLEELKLSLSHLEEELSLKSVELEEVNKKMTASRTEYEGKIQDLLAGLNSDQSKHSSLESQVEEYKLNETVLKDKIVALEKQVDALSSRLGDASEETQRMKMDYEGQANMASALKQELADKCSEINQLLAQIGSLKKQYEVDVQNLQTKLVDAETESDSIKSQIQNYKENELSLMNKIDLLNDEKQETVSRLHEEICKRRDLELVIEGLKQFILSLEYDLSRMSEECGNIDQEFLASQSKYEVNIQTLENQLSFAKKKHSSLEKELNNNLSYANDIKERLKSVEEEKAQMSGAITAESDIVSLEEENAKLLDEAVLLREQVSCQSLELADLRKAIENVNEQKNEVEKLEKKLLESEAEQVNCQMQIDHLIKVKSSTEMEVQKLVKENQEIASSLRAEMQKTKDLEKEVEHVSTENMSLKKQMGSKSLLLNDMAIEKAQYRINIQTLQNKLTTAEEKYSSLEKELNNNLSYANEIKERLKSVEEEKAQISSAITAESNKVVSLEAENAKLLDEVVLLREQVSCQSLELADLRKAIENGNEQKSEIKLAKKVLESETAQVNFQTQIDGLIKMESSTEMEVQKTKDLEKEVELVSAENMALKKEVDCKSLLLNDMAVEKAQYRAKIEELENKLLCSPALKSAYGNFSKELRLDENVGTFCISSMEENLSVKSFVCEELAIENETLKEEFERTIQELQAEISGVRSENEHLRVQMRNISLNAESSQKRLELVEREKQCLDKQLNFENKKIKLLESGIQELKKIIITLQVLLISNNRDIKRLNSEAAGSKDCTEFPPFPQFKDDVICRSIIAAEKECMSTTRTETESTPTFYFPEFKTFSSLPEKEFSAALQKFSFYSLNQICDLENNLISKLERCKFLCSYQLVDHTQLNELWKIFLFLRRKLRQIQLLKKFMVCFCNILRSSLVAHILQSVNKVALVKVFPKNFGFTLKDFLYLCNNAFNKILFSVSQTFEKDSSLVNQHSVFFSKYSNVHSNAFHLPAIEKTTFVLCHPKFQRIYWDLKPKHVSEQKLEIIFSARRQDVKKALSALNAQDVPFFLNFTMSLMEKMGNEFRCSPNNFTNATTSGHFSLSALQMKNYISLLEPSSPIFQILSKYCMDILNLENITVHDICYWKYHCNILGIDKCDVQKMITLLEHMDKHKKVENAVGNTLLENDKHVKQEVSAQKNEKSLEECLKIEKEKQNLLNTAIEEIEKDLGETFLQKEKFKNMALNVGKMLLCLKKYDAESLVFSNIHWNGGEISTETCFCENCIMDENMSDSPSHDVLALDHCLKCMDRLIHSGCQLEKEVCELRKVESELKALSRTLKDKNSELEMTVDQCNRNLENAQNQVQDVTYRLQNQKEKYESLSRALNEKDTLNMQLKAENDILLNSVDEYRTKLKVLEEEISSLSIIQEKLEFSLLCRAKEVESLKATIDENSSLLNKTQKKCEEYRNEIHLLNSRISKYEEEKMIDQHSISQNVSLDNSFVPDDLVKSSKTVINELQAKIDSLTKSNNSLNLTIENIEEELKNVYMEKKGVVEELEKLSEQIAGFKQEILVSTQKYNDEKRSTANLLLRLNEYEKIVLDNENIIKELKTKNETLENNACQIENMAKEQEQMVSEKNSDLSKCHQVIEQLQKQIEELDKANSDLKVQTVVIKMQECLKAQLNEVISQKSELEKEIERLKLVETEKDQILKRLSEANLQRDQLTEEFCKIKSEFEAQKKKNTDLEIKCTELSDSLKDASLEKELNKNNKHQLNEIAFQKSELEKEIERLKLVEMEKVQILERLSEANLERDDLAEKFCQLKLEFETQEKKSIDLEIKCSELSSSLKDAINSNASLEKELNKNKNLILILKKQREESSVELKNITSTKWKLIDEISALKSIEKDLTRQIETLTKNLKEAKDNAKAECSRNQILVKENETLKKSDNAHADIGTELQKLRNTLNGAYNFIVNVLNTILCAVQIYPENADFEELSNSLMALIFHCTQKSEKEFQMDMFDQLNSFFGTLINSHKDDLVICGLVSSIKDSVTSIAAIDQPCPGADASPDISPGTMCNMSIFESTFVGQTNIPSLNILADLKFIKARTEEVIFNFKKIISEKTEEIEKLKKELKQIPTTRNESKPTESDKASFKWKYELIKRQYHWLEEKYNALVISSEKMEQTIENLKVENKNLNEEAEELSTEIKNMQAYYNNSDELLEALTEVNSLRHKLREVENENKWLMKEMQECQRQQTSAEKTYSGADLNSLRHKLKELENENNWLKKKIQEFQLQQMSPEKPYSSRNQMQTQIPKFDKTYLKENNVNRCMKGS